MFANDPKPASALEIRGRISESPTNRGSGKTKKMVEIKILTNEGEFTVVTDAQHEEIVTKKYIQKLKALH